MQTLKIWYWLRNSKKNKKNIYFRIYLNNTDTNNGHSTGISINEKDWNQINQCAMPSSSKHKEINKMLANLESQLLSFFFTLPLQQSNCTAIDFYKMYLDRNKPIKISTCLDVFAEYIELIKSKVSTNQINETTLFTWQNKYNLFKKYLKYSNKENITIDKVDRGEYYKLLSYFLNVLNLKNNYVSKTMSNIKTFMNFAVECGYIKTNPFLHLNLRKVENEIIYLNQIELSELEKFQTENTTLQKVKYFFLFQCYTGIDYVDVCNLKKENLMIIDNKEWIVYQRQKTKNKPNQPKAYIPLFIIPKAKEIINRFGIDNIPKMTNQRLNFYLKVIAEMVGIKKKIHTKMSRKTFAMYMRNTLNFSLDSVAVMLGDKDLNIVQTHYTYPTIDKIMNDLNNK